eukprot:COSAG01_NODE_7849_length_3026_cov_7.544585_1_plen_672_part_00
MMRGSTFGDISSGAQDSRAPPLSMPDGFPAIEFDCFANFAAAMTQEGVDDDSSSDSCLSWGGDGVSCSDSVDSDGTQTTPAPAVGKRRRKDFKSDSPHWERIYELFFADGLEPRPDFLPDNITAATVELFYRERTDSNGTGKLPVRNRHTDLWKSQGPRTEIRCTLGRFRRSMADGSPGSLLRCTTEEAGVGDLVMVRRPMRVQRRDMTGKMLPRGQQGIRADEWFLVYTFDEAEATAAYADPIRLFHVCLPGRERNPVPPLPTASASASASALVVTEQCPLPTRLAAPLRTLQGPIRVQSSASDSWQPLMTLRAPQSACDTTFMRFQEADREIGSIGKTPQGLRILTSSGDFAEWHAALHPEDLPFREGHVVGFFGEKISLRTAGADMFGIVSERAVVVGSADSMTLASGACIAYMGRVPVNVIGEVIPGDLLVPSGRQDGSAKAVPRGSSHVDQSLGVAQTRKAKGSSQMVTVCVRGPGLARPAARHLSRCAMLGLIIAMGGLCVLAWCLDHDGQPHNIMVERTGNSSHGQNGTGNSIHGQNGNVTFNGGSTFKGGNSSHGQNGTGNSIHGQNGNATFNGGSTFKGGCIKSGATIITSLANGIDHWLTCCHAIDHWLCGCNSPGIECRCDPSSSVFQYSHLQGDGCVAFLNIYFRSICNTSWDGNIFNC